MVQLPTDIYLWTLTCHLHVLNAISVFQQRRIALKWSRHLSSQSINGIIGGSKPWEWWMNRLTYWEICSFFLTRVRPRLSSYEAMTVPRNCWMEFLWIWMHDINLIKFHSKLGWVKPIFEMYTIYLFLSISLKYYLM